MRHQTLLRTVLLSVQLMLLALAVALLPQPGPVQAASQPAQPVWQLQSQVAVTIYLPSVKRATTPEEQLVELINQARQQHGLSPLTVKPLLQAVAEAHSQDMVDRNFFSHTNPDGLGPGDRLAQAGYHGWGWGETIGAGYPTAEAMLEGWLDSPDHRAILLSDSYTEIGLGYVAGGNYGHYWTATFGRS